MPNENPPQSPSAADDPKGGSDRHGTRNERRHRTYEEWNAVFQRWKEGERNQKELARLFRVDADTIGRWVHKGVPGSGYPSFHDRLRNESDIVREAKAKAAARMTDELLDERGKVRRGNLEVLMDLRRVVGATLAKAVEKFNSITWTKREIEHGKLIERPLNAHEYASILRQLSGAMALVGKMESFFVGDVMDDEDIPEELKFTPEELKFIQTPGNEDKLPPGMTLDQLARKTAAWCGAAPMKPGN